MRKSSSAFTLVELSVVLVIIGLIVGGILVGNDLIESSRRLSVISDLQKFQSAINAFRGKYGALPGDVPCAEASIDFPGGYCSASSPKKDGIIGYWDGFASWQQLARAGVIAGNYNGQGYNGAGLGSAGTNPIVMGYDVPEAKLQGVGYQILAIFANLYSLSNDINVIAVAKNTAVGPYDVLSGAVFPSQDARDLDQKIDDGKPRTGSLRSNNDSYAPNTCYTGSGATATYNIATSTANCALGFVF